MTTRRRVTPKKGPNFVTHHRKVPRCTFTTYHTFPSTASYKDYKFYNSWALDSGTDVNVWNDKLRSFFTKTLVAGKDEQLFTGKMAYAIECFGTVNVEVNIPDGTATWKNDIVPWSQRPS
jgi:hypothetical protein